MSDPRFFYTSEIDTKIPHLIKNTLHTDVLSLHKVAQGEENHVYIVTTPEKKVVLRVFGTELLGGEEKLQLLSQKLEKYKVPYPKLLSVSLAKQYFPYGYMISEFINGENGKEAIAKGHISFEAFHKQLFVILRKVHSIPGDNFGFFNGEGFDSVVAFKLDQVAWCFEQLKEEKEVYERKDEIYNLINNSLSPLEHKIKPVFIHYDPTPSNCIYTPDGYIVLVDWDSAASECFMRDIAWLTYWGSHLTSEGPKEERQKVLWELFIKQYQNFGFTEQELRALERIYHICIAVELLPYFYVSQKNFPEYEETKIRLEKLLKEIA